jgi:hypothetical protein
MGNIGEQRTYEQASSGYFFANQVLELPSQHDWVPGSRPIEQRVGKRPVASPLYGFPVGIPMYAGGK